MAAKEPSPLKDLITANHILHNHHVLDAYGHISLRNPNNPQTFFLSHSIAPALITSPSDIVEYNIEDASPVQDGVSKGYLERCIHSEILKKYPGVNSVIHSHSEAVLPYTISGVELKPCFHMAGFLGPHVPVFELATHYTHNDNYPHDLLISNTPLGSVLASHFSKPTSYASRISTAGAALASNFLSKDTTEPSSSFSSSNPDYTVVLMRGHGFTTLGSSVQEAVFRAIYTQQNASVQTTAMMLQNIHVGSIERGKGREEKGVRDEDARIKSLGGGEMEDCKEMGQKTMGRPWGLWVREVETNPFYVNEA